MTTVRYSIRCPDCRTLYDHAHRLSCPVACADPAALRAALDALRNSYGTLPQSERLDVQARIRVEEERLRWASAVRHG